MDSRRGYLLAATLVVAGCATLAGLDEDYSVGGSATGSASTTTGTAAGTTTGTAVGGGSTSTGSGGSGTTTPTGTGGDGGTLATGGSGGGIVQCTGQHTYDAEIADCINMSDPDPDACETYGGAGNMSISTSAHSVGTPHHAFLRFDLDSEVARSALSAVTLRVTVSSRDHADSGESGEIWRVAPFIRTDLFSGAPSQVGSSALAASQGAVAANQTVLWSLPTNIVDGESVYLEMRPLVADNAIYFNAIGAVHPQLVVDCD